MKHLPKCIKLPWIIMKLYKHPKVYSKCCSLRKPPIHISNRDLYLSELCCFCIFSLPAFPFRNNDGIISGFGKYFKLPPRRRHFSSWLSSKESSVKWSKQPKIAYIVWKRFDPSSIDNLAYMANPNSTPHPFLFFPVKTPNFRNILRQYRLSEIWYKHKNILMRASCVLMLTSLQCNITCSLQLYMLFTCKQDFYEQQQDKISFEMITILGVKTSDKKSKHK